VTPAIKVSYAEPYLTFVARVSNRPVARAHVRIDNQTAELLDIRVYQTAQVQRHVRWLTYWMPSSRKLRGRGIGTELLTYICQDLKGRGVSRLWGAMSGDIPKLIRWYSRCGFEVGQETGLISRTL
jgi:GNAT superfamily N-acetyltransferase